MRAFGSQMLRLLNVVEKYQVPSAVAHLGSWKGKEKASPLSKYA